LKFATKLPGMTLYPGRGKHWWENITAAEMADLAGRIDALGYDYLELPTHFVMNHASAKEMGPRWTHSLVAAGFVAGATRRITIQPLIIVPNHNPIELAKALATADYLSGGRVRPLLLVGYKEWEFELLNQDFSARGRMMTEYIEAMIELWEHDDPVFKGEFVSFDDVVFDPKPLQRPLPLMFGGHTKVALRRIARFGVGWYSSMTTREEFPALVDFIRSQPEFQANPRPLELSLPTFEGVRDKITHQVYKQPKIEREREAILDALGEIAELGATLTDANDFLGIGKYQNDSATAPPACRDIHEYIDRLEWFAAEILPAAREIAPAMV
jgi:hypothetical protein